MSISTKCTCGMSHNTFCNPSVKQCKQRFEPLAKKVASYTRDQIKEAIRAELTEADHMGKDNSRYYEIVGIVMEGLDKIDKQKEEQ